MNPRRFLLLALLGSVSLRSELSAGVPSPARFSLSQPLDYQVSQRETRESGRVVLRGTLLEPLRPADRIEARLEGLPDDGGWQTVLEGPSPIPTTFSASLVTPAGGWYRLEVRVLRGDHVTDEAVVPHVGVGEVFVVAGQSNSANHGAERQQVATGRVAAFTGERWQIADDPQPGASGSGGSFLPPFGDALVHRFDVPIGLIAAGMGATSVREWLPQGATFPHPPTLTGHVTRKPGGEWESHGLLFSNLVNRIKAVGPRNFRAVLWHQGESDARQQNPRNTLPGPLYSTYLARLIRETRTAIGWEVPWFVAQASYHTPNDPGSPEIRAAQAALWQSGLALAGPDTDALRGELRDEGGQGVHFSGVGLREHADRWVDKVAPWLKQQLSDPAPHSAHPAEDSHPYVAGPTPRLILPGMETFKIDEHPAFVLRPPPELQTTPQPWIFYAPTLPGYPDEAERWMHEAFLAAGVAVAGVDVGESYGSPASLPVFDALHRELTGRRAFARRPCLLGRSRGGLWISSWALAHPDRVAGLVGIYPVFDFRTYPGLAAAAPAYGLTSADLEIRLSEFNPVSRLEILAHAHIPALLLHGDQDSVVPLPANSAEFARRYQAANAGPLVNLIVLKGQGHSFFEGFFHCQALVEFAVTHAWRGATD